MNKYNIQGFGLIEIIITLTIIGILTLVAIPSFITQIKNYRLSATAENLYYALQYARTEAIKRNATIYVSFTTGDNWCYGINVGSACNCTVPANCGLGTTSASATQTLTLSTSGYSGGSVYFEGSHGAANASGSLTFTLYQQTSLIKISIGTLGNLQLCSTGISGYTGC